VNRLQPPDRDAVIDRRLARAQVKHLGPADHPMLRGSQLGNRHIDMDATFSR
jgi:hypothetical protein